MSAAALILKNQTSLLCVKSFKHQLSVRGPFTPITINHYNLVWLYVRNAIILSLEQHIALPIEVRILFCMVQFVYRLLYFLS